MSSRNSYAFGKMNATQTRNAVNYIREYEGMSNSDIANIISGYKGAPSISRHTVYRLRQHLAENS